MRIAERRRSGRAAGEAVTVPLELEVYPFALEKVLPVSFGMYYNPREEAGLAAGSPTSSGERATSMDAQDRFYRRARRRSGSS